MKMKLLFMITLVVLICLTVGIALAVTYDVTDGALTYTVDPDAGYAYVKSCNTRATDAVIAPKVEGYPVTGVGDYAFERCYYLTRVTIPDSVTSIGESAFSHCYDLLSVTIPKRLADIGDYAFYSCDKLTEITLPDTVTDIGEGAFEFCDHIMYITVKAGTRTARLLSDSGWRKCVSPSCPELLWHESDAGLTVMGLTDSGLAKVILPNRIDGVRVIGIGDYAFSECKNLTGITIPDGVKNIGISAFYGCENLMDISFPDGLKGIGKSSFYFCKSLTRVTVPGNVTDIGESAFESCLSLSDLTIENGVTEIGEFAFAKCGSLKSVTVPGTVKRIGEDAFYLCKSLTDVTIRKGVTGIGPDAFSCCTALKSITIPDSVRRIDYRAFYNCTALKSITIPDSVTSIGYGLFIDCESLAEVRLPEELGAITDEMFEGCGSLKSVTVPDGVTRVGEKAFYGCNRLTSVTIPQSVFFIGDSAFSMDVRIICYKESWADTWAKANGRAREYLRDAPVTAITLNKSAKTLTVTAGEKHPTYQLSVKKVSPADVMIPKVLWNSGNKEIVTVDRYGLVKAVAPGETTVTATAEDGSGVKATCRITVVNQKVKSFIVAQEGKTENLKDATVTLKRGKTLKLQILKLKPATAVDRKIIFTSSDKKIATVSKNGVIKAIKKGTVTITVESRDKGYSVRFKVRVK